MCGHGIKDGETERMELDMDPNKFELYLYLGFFVTVFMLLYAYLFIMKSKTYYSSDGSQMSM